jgi:predicted ATPase with chaperone activity
MNPILSSTPACPATEAERKLEELLGRLSTLSASAATNAHAALTVDPARSVIPESKIPNDGEFCPRAPRTLAESGLTAASVEELICKFLLARGEATLREITHQIKLPFGQCEFVTQRMKQDQTLTYIGQAAANDYICRLSEIGREKAKRYSDLCSYFGAAPVPFKDYVDSVKAQTITKQHPSEDDLKRAFSDLLISPDMFRKLGPAVNSGRGMFLYGYPGNGKTSIAERVTAAFGRHIWIPRSISIDRDLIRVFDPMNHVEEPLKASEGLLQDDSIDQRWVRIRRPTIVVGGELRMEHLELQYNPISGISEAPVQMKSNCGLLLIDDFGRQQISVDELLNRWIVPLEKRHDYLNTSSGKKVQVPFDQLVIFSTNLEPKDLVDDAFLRRIPYKIEVPNPSREYFVQLFEIMCRIVGCEYNEALINQMIEKHYLPVNRPFRNCHPRDLLLQIRNLCSYEKKPFVLSEEGFDFAVDNYFSMM